jgi:hypothetical protein
MTEALQLRLIPESPEEVRDALRTRKDVAARRYKGTYRMSTEYRAGLLADYLIAACELRALEGG